jgi:hypothetical protein
MAAGRTAAAGRRIEAVGTADRTAPETRAHDRYGGHIGMPGQPRRAAIRSRQHSALGSIPRWAAS